MPKKILVIGAGPGGYPAALKAAELGAEVTIAEQKDIGGVCLNRGCIPSKSFLDAGHRLHSLNGLAGLVEEKAADMLGGVRYIMDWNRVQQRRKDIILKLRGSVKRALEARKIEILTGTASFLSPGEAQIKTAEGSVTRKFDAAIIAAGTRPFFPPPFDSARESLLDSDRIFDIGKIPASVAVIGGGAIGCEFSCFFHAMGAGVSLVEMLPGLMPGEDEAAARVVRTSFEKRGIKFHLGRKAVSIDVSNRLRKITLDDGSVIEAEAVLVSTGRTAQLEGLGLEKIGLEWNRKGIKADDRLRTAVPGVFAVGDVNGFSLLAHAATAQGEIAAANAMGGNEAYDNSLIPRCLYSWPELASVGLNKKDAESRGVQARARRAFFAASGKALTHEETEGFVQIVSDAVTDRIIGAQIVGGPATELIHVFSVAIKAAMTGKELSRVVFAHPTMAETIHEALLK